MRLMISERRTKWVWVKKLVRSLFFIRIIIFTMSSPSSPSPPYNFHFSSQSPHYIYILQLINQTMKCKKISFHWEWSILAHCLLFFYLFRILYLFNVIKNHKISFSLFFQPHAKRSGTRIHKREIKFVPNFQYSTRRVNCSW